MQVKIPEADIQRADLTAISVGHVAIGPITVGELVLNNTKFTMTGFAGVLQNMHVTVTLHIAVEWHVHVGLPDGIPDIDIGDTYNRGSFSFSMPVGDVMLKNVSNIDLVIPTLTAQSMSVAADPLTNLQLAHASAEQIKAQNIALPTAGFTLAGLTLNSVQGSAISVPAAKVDQATIGHVHGDPVTIPAFTLRSLNLPALQIPAIASTSPFDIQVDLQGLSPGFDAGILRLVLHITPSVLSHIERLEISGAKAVASVGQVVLTNVVLPYDVLNLTLSQVGINTIGIPAFSVS